MQSNLIWPVHLDKERDDQLLEEIKDRFERRLIELEIRNKTKSDKTKGKES